MLTILDQSHPDWWSAELNGKTGLIPAKYVAVIEAAPPVVAPTNPTPAAMAPINVASVNAEEPKNSDLGRSVALYDCTPPRQDVLGFKKGDIIILLSQSSDDWYVGECEGRTGLVAKNYVRMLPEEMGSRNKSPRPTSQAPTGAPQGPPAGVRAPSLRSEKQVPPTATGSVPPPVGIEQRRPSVPSVPVSLGTPIPQAGAKAVPAKSPRPVSSSGGVPAVKAPPPSQAPRAVGIPDASSAAGVPFRAIADYVGARENVLSFSKGDVILIVDRSRQDWWRGVLRGRTGAVPASYVKPVENPAVAAAPGGAGAVSGAGGAVVDPFAGMADDGDRRARRSTIVASPDIAAKMRAAAEAQKGKKFATAMYPFTQEKPGVLVFKKGDVLTILDDSRIDWWKAELHGKVGMVPAKYVQIQTGAVGESAVAPQSPATQPAAAAVQQQQQQQQQAPVKTVAAVAAIPAASAGPVQKLVALQPYKSPRPDILGLEPGMEMTLLGKPTPDWWKVELRGRVGLVPAKLVQPMINPKEAAPTGNVAAGLVDPGATLRTQKAQHMAVAAAAAQGKAPAAMVTPLAVVPPVVPGLALQQHTGTVGETVEALVGTQWQRVVIAAVQEDGYLVSAGEGAPQVHVQKIRKVYGSAPAHTEEQQVDFRGNLKKSPRPDAGAVGVAPVAATAPVKVPVTATSPVVPKKTAPQQQSPVKAPVKVVEPPVVPKVDVPSPDAPPVVAPPTSNPIGAPPVLPPYTPPVTQLAVETPAVAATAHISPRSKPVVHQPENDFEEARQEAKRRAEGAFNPLDLGFSNVTMADLDRALGLAADSTDDSVLEPVAPGTAPFKEGQAVEALFGESTDDWYSATVLSAKRSRQTGSMHYMVRYDEYGNERLIPASSVRAVEAPPDVVDIAMPTNMKYEIGSTIEAQYTEDNEWYVAQVKAHTPEGNYDVMFIEYGNHQECAPNMVRDLTVPLEEVLPLINEIPKGGFNLKFKVNDYVHARYADDGQFYAAQIKGITPMGTYWVVFTEYGNEQEATEEDVWIPQ